MNKTILLISFMIVLFFHLSASKLLIKDETKKEIYKPKYQKVSVQLAKMAVPKTKEKTIKKKKVFKKKIEKIVKKKTVKKAPRKIQKKEIQKKQEKQEKEPIKKKNLQKIAKKNQSKFLEKSKKFKRTYLIALREAIDKNKKYPRISKRLEEQGMVLISFTVLKSGLFKNIKVLTSSGKKRLDKAALKALELTGKFKPFGKEIKKEFLELTVPINFKLK